MAGIGYTRRRDLERHLLRLLLEGERLELILRPHPVAFVDLHVFWILFGVFGPTSLAVGTALVALGETIPGLAAALASARGETPRILVSLFIFVLSAGALSIAQAVKKTSVAWLLPLVPAAGATAALAFTGSSLSVAFLAPLCLALLVESLVESYRVAHLFVVTDRRLLFLRRHLLLPESTVECYYHHITNLVTKRTVLERVFGAGTVIPVMTSGLNLGSEVVGISGNFLVFSLSASREKRMPRALPYLCFFSVPHYERVAKAIVPHVVPSPHVP